MTRISTSRLCWLAVLAYLLGAPTAHAQSESTRETIARTAFEDGLRLAGEGRYREARESLLRSREIAERTTTLVNLTVVELRLGLLVESFECCQALLARAEREGNAEALARGRELQSEIDALIARVRLTVQPPDAQLLLDAEPRPEVGAERELVLSPGRYRLAFRAEGHESQRSSLELSAGEVRELTVELEQVESAPVAPTPREAAATAAPSVNGTGEPATSEPARDAPNRRLRRALWISGALLVAGGIATGLAFALQPDAPDRCIVVDGREPACPAND